MERFAECFAELPDPRAANALHDLTDLLFTALLATLCGATSCTDMALFARTKAYLLEPVLVASVREEQGMWQETARGFIVPDDWRARAAQRQARSA